VIERIHDLMNHDVAGDSITGIKWTRRTTAKIASELQTLDIQVGARTVARLLKDLRYSLRVNQKRVARGSGPDRNEQFEHISQMRTKFAERDLPIVSIDTKKKETVGNFKNNGSVWRMTPELVLDHDFPSYATGKATPYGIYDVRANRGAVFVGMSKDTPDFAVDNLARWWKTEGCKRYPDAAELLVLADGGGSNGPRCRAFKYGLQTRLCDEFGITVTVCHYPTGASKWNPIEHRLFSEISKIWAGCPLRDCATILNYINTTRTKTGLVVTAKLIEQEYPGGVKIPDALMATIDLHPHDAQPLRNYTIRPCA
jgi:hypothetical protein